MKRRLLLIFIFIFIFIVIFFLYKTKAFSKVSLPGVSDASQVTGILLPADENEGVSFDLKAYEKDGEYLLFLPARADISDLTIYMLGEGDEPLERARLDLSGGVCLLHEAIVLRAYQSLLPSVEISFSGTGSSLEEVEDDKDHEFRAFGDMVVSCTDEAALQNGWETVVSSRNLDYGLKGSMSLRGHGNASWLLDKKSYNVYWENLADVLSMGMDDEWVLLADGIDRTLLRNQVFYDMAEKCGIRYSPKLRKVELFIDGDYRGVYSLTTKVRINENSVDIRQGHDFLYRWGMPGDEARPLSSFVFRDEPTNVVEVRDLKDESVREKAFKIADDLMLKIEDTSSDECLSMIDMESWAKYYWIQELGKNTDATSRSLYTVWMADEGRMYMNPVWDMDQTAGVVEPYMREVDYLYPQEWAVRYEEWYKPLFEHGEFAQKVDEVYRRSDMADVMDECIKAIPQKAEDIRTAAMMNFLRWDILDEPQNNRIYFYMEDTSWDAQVEWLHIWLKYRKEWIDEECK